MAIALLVLDHRGGWLVQVRRQAEVVAQPFWWLAGLPGRLTRTVSDDAATRSQLIAENKRLRNDLLVANARLTRLGTAAADNAKLRSLLGMVESRGLDVQLAPILNIDLDPTRQRLVLDAGRDDGVRVGQAVIDDGGLMGQIIQTTPDYATVLLLTDPDHALPVMIGRSGVRLMVYGSGRSDHLELVNVPLNADVKEGDVVLTSGLGGRFPAGFPVGTVSTLRQDETQAFLVGQVTPAARLDRGRDVLLLRSAPQTVLPPPQTQATGSGAAPASGTQVPTSASANPTPNSAAPNPAESRAPYPPAQPAQETRR